MKGIAIALTVLAAIFGVALVAAQIGTVWASADLATQWAQTRDVVVQALWLTGVAAVLSWAFAGDDK